MHHTEKRIRESIKAAYQDSDSPLTPIDIKAIVEEEWTQQMERRTAEMMAAGRESR